MIIKINKDEGFVNIIDRLKEVPAGLGRFIAVSALHIHNAALLAEDNMLAVDEAKRIYRRRGRGGRLWRCVQGDAKRVLRIVAENGLTEEKPYLIRRDGKYASVFAIVGDQLGCIGVYPDRRPL